LYKVHVLNKRVTTVRFASSLKRTDRPAFDEKNVIIVDRRTLISKNPRIYDDQDELILTSDDAVEFRPISNSNSKKTCGVQLFSYRLEMSADRKEILLKIIDRDDRIKEQQWLKENLLPKMNKWFESDVKNPSEIGTLTLIDIEEYQREYERLKSQYGKYLTSNWCESTDPQKHVFEDLAIASYLLRFHRENPTFFRQPIKFVDLGCGNGLLTFILVSEGLQGVGLDMRSRRSWSLFNSSLYQQTLIDPQSSQFHEFIQSNQFSLLIGNHSDELTPWFPVLSARCQCDVFLIPCCFYEFSGKKFISKSHPDRTQYEQYLSFIENLTRTLNLSIQRDKLRIPSTKNFCFLIQHSESIKTFDEIRADLIKDFQIDIQEENAEPKIEKREKPRDLFAVKYSIVEQIFKHLLHEHKPLTLASAYEILPNHLAEELKSERGGLKSIVLSYRHALHFDPIKKLIDLADPKLNSISLKEKSLSATKIRLKTKDCFFHLYHPSGCPLTDDQCAFFHRKK